MADIGRSRRSWKTKNLAASAWKLFSYPAAAICTGGVARISVALMFRGGFVEERPTDANGDVSFFDLNPGNYSAHQYASGNAWQITAYASAPPDVTRIASGGITGFASFG